MYCGTNLSHPESDLLFQPYLEASPQLALAGFTRRAHPRGHCCPLLTLLATLQHLAEPTCKPPRTYRLLRQCSISNQPILISWTPFSLVKEKFRSSPANSYPQSHTTVELTPCSLTPNPPLFTQHQTFSCLKPKFDKITPWLVMSPEM